MIQRDLLKTLKHTPSLEALLLWGPRQVGKTTLLEAMHPRSSFYLDDLSVRERAQNDPAFLFSQADFPCLIDEAQYAPNLFPEIKLQIDRMRRERRRSSLEKKEVKLSFLITGSNKTLLDRNIKESLAGRCNVHALHGLSIHEVLNDSDRFGLKDFLFRGGFPELYVRSELSPIQYLNDYILSFIEKDIAGSSRIEKITEFNTVLRLLAARTGQFLDTNEIANAAGVDFKTVQSWIGLLQRNLIIELVSPFSSNLSKRIVKMKKLYFCDAGIASRLQGHLNSETLWNSPQTGALFETLVFSELMKTRDHFLRDYRIHTWRTKDQHEIDFVLESGNQFILIESKLGIHGTTPFTLDSEAKKVFKNVNQKIVVTSGGELENLDRETLRVPISKLAEFLRSSGV